MTHIERPAISRGLVNPRIEDPALLDKRHKEIIAAATALFTERGYHATKVDEIARAAGMSVGLLYRYVHSKEEILLLILDDIMSGYEAELEPVLSATEDPVEQLKAAITAYCRAINRNRRGALLAYQATAALAEPRRALIKQHELATHSILVEIIERGVAAERFRPVDARLLAYNIIMAAHTWAVKRWYLRSHYTLEEYIAAQTDMVLRQLL